MLLKMLKNTFFPIITGLVLSLISCGNISTKSKANKYESKTVSDTIKTVDKSIIVGANQMENYLDLLKNKKVGIVGNQSSVIFKNDSTENIAYVHLVDSLLSQNVDIIKVFSPEHGFRGTADAGEMIKDGIDNTTGLPIISLYGNNKKPSPDQLKGLDLLIFDIQDVGVRFYTYISTLHYVMEACAEAKLPLLILDRPNPNGYYVDGPILDKKHSSFVGMHPIPIAHGMTIGEYAQMINGENWLKNGVQCEITVIPIKNYNHDMRYSLPIKPSPNLPNDQSIALYPSLCFFEGTNVSVGRGTSDQFQIYGSPDLDSDYFKFSFTPQPNEGAKHPPKEGKLCYGENLTETEVTPGINLTYLIEAYQHTADKKKFFNNFFIKLAGTLELQKQIQNGLAEEDIKASWKKGLEEFKAIRTLYLLYP